MQVIFHDARASFSGEVYLHFLKKLNLAKPASSKDFTYYAEWHNTSFKDKKKNVQGITY